MKKRKRYLIFVTCWDIPKSATFATTSAAESRLDIWEACELFVIGMKHSVLISTYVDVRWSKIAMTYRGRLWMQISDRFLKLKWLEALSIDMKLQEECMLSGQSIIMCNHLNLQAMSIAAFILHLQSTSTSFFSRINFMRWWRSPHGTNSITSRKGDVVTPIILTTLPCSRLLICDDSKLWRMFK